METKRITSWWACLALGTPFMFFAQTPPLNNTFQGQQTGTNNVGSYNAGFGFFTLTNNGGNSNAGFGNNVLTLSKGSFNCGFGNGALANNDTGELNVAIGTRALENNLTGNRNVAIGHRSMGNVVNPGSNNTAVGFGSLFSTYGSGNVALGSMTPRHMSSGNNNVFVGNETAINLLTGDNNVILGRVAVSTDPTTPIIAGNNLDRSIIIADGAGAQRIFVSSTGNIGLGLGNNVIPNNRLDVNGGVVIGRNYTSRSWPTPTAGFTAPANGLLVEGRVGFGTATPGNRLEIAQGTPGASGLRFTNLTSAFVPTNTTFSDKFLTVNAAGDVVLERIPSFSISNQLQSNQNTLQSNVNGVTTSTPIINSVATVIDEGNQLVTIINGVPSAPVTLPIPSYIDTDGQTLALNGQVLSISNGNSVTLPVDGDSNATNELQTLTQNGNTITLSNGGGSFTLPVDTDTDGQTLALNGQVLSISNGNSVTLPVDGDSNATNELQTLTQNGNTITLSNGGGSFTLPVDTDTDGQTLALNGQVLSISNGNSVTLPVDGDSNATNELQTLTQNGNTITLSNGGGSFTLPVDTDAQTLALNGNVLTISNGNNITLPTTQITAGTNVTVTGNGTAATPFVINANDTSLYSANGSINQATTTGLNRVVTMNNRNIWFNSTGSGNNGKIYIGNTATYPASTGNYRLYVEGGILTEKVKVALRSTANWADYVFADDYRLMPLNEVEAFIQKNKHLPGVASAETLAKEGLDVAAMQAKHMEKIEELTLYVIDQNKTIEAQQATLSKQQQEIDQLKAQLELLIQKMK
ncbi:MAG: hypothetical protein O9297_02700 [Flavobacterium sp.]|jgi:uncharacterized coiled-coil protein SlyX|uniref:hypothetical protein n=1 Tax=Flavobacterium sp. TaxID=239 RepID=UPI0022BCDFB8|nr:hypothetical protein [Flavobacterium sp.]MCZ8169372.1 hypothetical protein [Flavobacterium sp.]MCZ8296112.1 hypothetical protein [Flavobacterium sp.]